MKELKQAITKLFINHPLKDVVNGLYWVNDKKGTRTPYIRVETITGNSTYRMSGKDEMFRVQFTIFCKDENTCYDILGFVKDCFNDATLDYDNYYNIQCRSFNENGVMYVDETYQYVIEYEIIRAK
jgi:hypothetical protein